MKEGSDYYRLIIKQISIWDVEMFRYLYKGCSIKLIKLHT